MSSSAASLTCALAPCSWQRQRQRERDVSAMQIYRSLAPACWMRASERAARTKARSLARSLVRQVRRGRSAPASAQQVADGGALLRRLTSARIDFLFESAPARSMRARRPRRPTCKNCSHCEHNGRRRFAIRSLTCSKMDRASGSLIMRPHFGRASPERASNRTSEELHCCCRCRTLCLLKRSSAPPLRWLN